MVAIKQFSDLEGGLRTWLRAQSDISDLVGTRVFFGVPYDLSGKPATEFPLITIQRIGGSPQDGEAPLDDGLVQLDCWAQGKNKAQAWAVANAVIASLESMTPQLLDTEVYGYGASVDSVIFSPDPEDDRARYTITASVTNRAA